MLGRKISIVRRLAIPTRIVITPSRRFATVDADIAPSVRPALLQTSPTIDEPYWQGIGRWQDVSKEQFNTWRWQTSSTINTEPKLYRFLSEVLPETLEPTANPRLRHIRTKDQFVEDAMQGLKQSPMQLRLTPHILSVINWHRALDDPIRLQFLPLKSAHVNDHPKLELDSLHEKDDSPVEGLVHRYPNKALFLATSICPVYCRFCTRSYAVGGNTETVKKEPQKPSRKRWQLIYDYIQKTEALNDIVVSGGDTYYLQPEDIWEIGRTLLEMPNVQRIRFAAKGLAVAPSRTLDPNDTWTSTFIKLTRLGRKMNKQVCLHTHFNHPNEITWVTRAAAAHLYRNGVIVRNQSVLLRGVNDNVETMGTLLKSLASMNIEPYYVYQCDLVRGIEELRTPLQTILDLEQHLRGSMTGFMMPFFVVDLPGGGGKRLAHTRESYDKTTGISTFRAPGLPGEKGKKLYEYYDPLPIEAEASITQAMQHSTRKGDQLEYAEPTDITTHSACYPQSNR